MRLRNELISIREPAADVRWAPGEFPGSWTLF